MKIRLLTILLFTCSLVFAQQIKKDKRKQTQPLSSSIYLDSLDTEIQQDVATKDIVGATYLIYKKGTIVQKKAFGEANMLSHRAMKTDDIFRLASMTKPIASLALLLLQEDGLINMNDQLDQYLPAFKNPTVVDKIDTINGSTVLTTHPAKKPILLRHLLTHTAGFASQYGGNLGALYLGTFTNIYAHDLEYYANQVASLPLSHEPGDGWVYGPSINVAARVVEAVSGMSFQDFLQKRIFDPLQMKDTRFFYDISYADRITSHHTKTAEGQIKVEDPGDASSKLIAGPKVYYSGSGGLNSTLDDYIKFCVMVLNNGSHEGKMIAKPETIAMMKTDQVPLNINAILASQPSSFNEGFTFGYQIQRKNDNPSRTLGTISWLGATGPTFFIDPKNEVIGIYLTQMQPYSNIKSRKNFANWVLKATK